MYITHYYTTSLDCIHYIYLAFIPTPTTYPSLSIDVTYSSGSAGLAYATISHAIIEATPTAARIGTNKTTGELMIPPRTCVNAVAGSRVTAEIVFEVAGKSWMNDNDGEVEIVSIDAKLLAFNRNDDDVDPIWDLWYVVGTVNPLTHAQSVKKIKNNGWMILFILDLKYINYRWILVNCTVSVMLWCTIEWMDEWIEWKQQASSAGGSTTTI